MEKTIIEKKKLHAVLRLEDVCSIVCAVCIGFLAKPYAVCFIFPYLSYVYMRKQRECIFSMLAILICSSLSDVTLAYLYALGFTCFFLFIQILRLWDKNVFQYVPYIAACSIIPYALHAYGAGKESIVIVLIGMVLALELHRDEHWIHSKFIIDPLIYACVLFSVSAALDIASGYQYTIPIFSCGLLFIALISDLKALMVMSAAAYLLVGIEEFSLVYPAVLLIIGVFKKEKVLTALILISLYAYQLESYESIYVGAAAVLVLLYQEKLIPFLKKQEEIEFEDPISPQSLLRRQMNNFSSIFGSLAQYYEQTSSIGSDMLSNMAAALKFSADEIRKISGKGNMKERILNALEGYQYDVNYFHMEEIGEGSLHMEFDIKNIKKAEIKSTLVPLLEVLLHTRLRVASIRHIRFTSGYHHIVIETYVPFMVTAMGNAVKNPFDKNGDTYSVFRFRQSVVCMISDGMGVGERAGTASRLITNIFQRMIVSGIPQVESIKCINKLLQSDSYATLDVICFDQSEGVAYISKSAACPTYMIRNQEIHEISGSSLPVGIVSTVEPDCYSIDIQEGDEFLMVSDGVYMEEINAWRKTRSQKNVKEDVKEFIRLLEQNRRNDDSTILLAKVESA